MCCSQIQLNIYCHCNFLWFLLHFTLLFMNTIHSFTYYLDDFRFVPYAILLQDTQKQRWHRMQYVYTMVCLCWWNCSIHLADGLSSRSLLDWSGTIPQIFISVLYYSSLWIWSFHHASCDIYAFGVSHFVSWLIGHFQGSCMVVFNMLPF